MMRRFVVLAILFFGLLALPNATAVAYDEGFENCAQFDVPDQGACTSAQYSYTTGGTGSGVVSTAESHTGTKSLKLSTSTGFNVHFNAGPSPVVRCDSTTSLLAVDWWFMMPDLPTAAFELGVSQAPTSFDGSTNGIWVNIAPSGAVTGQADHDAAAIGPIALFTAVPDTWYHFQVGCSVEATAVTLWWREFETELLVQTGGGSTTNWDADPGMEILTFDMDGPTGPTVYYIDDIEYLAVGDPGFRYCAEPTEEDFAYTYSEGVVFADDSEDFSEAFISFEDYLLFEGDNDNSAYLAKGFTTGTTGIANIANIEAAEEATQSVFFIAFTTGAGGLPSVTTKATEVDKDNGIDGGNFDNSIQVRFLETSTNWAIKFFSNVAGNRNPIGSVINHGGDPNSAKVYNFTVDSLATTFTLKDGNGNVITTQNLPVGLHNAVWKDQWYVGKGDTLDFNAQTGVDDNTDADDNRNSTCIYDLTGTLVVDGSAGSTPGSLVPDSTSTPTGGAGAGGGGLAGFDESTSIWASLITIGIFGLLAIAISRGRFKRGDGGLE